MRKKIRPVVPPPKVCRDYAVRHKQHVCFLFFSYPLFPFFFFPFLSLLFSLCLFVLSSLSLLSASPFLTITYDLSLLLSTCPSLCLSVFLPAFALFNLSVLSLHYSVCLAVTLPFLTLPVLSFTPLLFICPFIYFAAEQAPARDRGQQHPTATERAALRHAAATLGNARCSWTRWPWGPWWP